MIPYRDDNPLFATPFVTWSLLAANLGLHIYRWFIPESDSFGLVLVYGAIPSQILSGNNLLSLFSSMYLHGDILHLAGNMMYLWVFADNVENIMGSFKFFIFYHICGLGAAATHILIDPTSSIPMIGASGAISGVLGAYLLTFPRARISVVIPILFFLYTMRVPAFFVLGIWFVFQIVRGVGALGIGLQDGIAWFAHIGGFLVGSILLYFFRNPPRFRDNNFDDIYFE
ncbi:MAG: rhomboid family intramembrane serine protease [Calditrichaeota bacterium]|nr:MAG: rhomboid family intramembrane serine protease [Calditrichota bacterium]